MQQPEHPPDLPRLWELLIWLRLIPIHSVFPLIFAVC